MQQNPAQFGPIPGVPLFRHFKDRRELYLAGVHGVPEGGIHGRAGTGAYSVVLSGRYTDDKDEGNVIWYTGAGGHSRTSEAQLGDQEWTRVNEALRVSEKTKQPVRVIRSSGVFSKFAPTKKGYRYDGLYQVKGAQMVIGKSGYQVCQFLLEVRPTLYRSLMVSASSDSLKRFDQRLDGQEPIPIYGIRIHSWLLKR
ncbi:hypothetical protein FA13DRAFT_339200 [Coprinellus micaceus]|uniref:YDG domain-containing protein n=1 Tax=Coprinellus micaceus TaxID=71717 RepID=A0A4Y7TCF0_COPMI|nr:hypothetical protein FA13DRAFT_339200 [Coprinellus micaceus]